MGVPNAARQRPFKILISWTYKSRKQQYFLDSNYSKDLFIFIIQRLTILFFKLIYSDSNATGTSSVTFDSEIMLIASVFAATSPILSTFRLYS